MSKWQWLAAGLVVLAAVISADIALRSRLKSSVDIYPLSEAHEKPGATLVVVLPGLVADARWFFRKIDPDWESNLPVHVWHVASDGDRFDPEATASAVAKMLENTRYRHVVFVGSSLGALIAHDAAEKLSQERRDQLQIDLLAICAPSGAQDLRPPFRQLTSLLRVVRFGPIANATFGRLIMRAITGKQLREFALTYWADQLSYVTLHEPLQRGVFDRVTYVQATQDEFVLPTAAEAWRPTARGGNCTVVEVDSTHAAYDIDPELWRTSLTEEVSKLVNT